MEIILLHGALGSERQLKQLHDRVGGHVMDLAGHGSRAIPPDGITFEHFIEDIDHLFAANSLTQAHLFGYSMGGYAALLYAARHPERVSSVVTLGTKYIWTEEGLQRELRMLDPDAMQAKVPAFVQVLAQVHGADRWREVVHGVAKSMTELAAAPLLTHEVCSRIQCRVLCCVGDGDTTAIPHDTRVFVSGLKPANVHVLPNTKHPFETVDLDILVPRLRTFWG